MNICIQEDQLIAFVKYKKGDVPSESYLSERSKMHAKVFSRGCALQRCLFPLRCVCLHKHEKRYL